MGQFGIGQPMRRKEDERFITGHGRYVSDIDLQGQAHGIVLRSPLAHAVIRDLDVRAAVAAPGVLGVFTGRDYLKTGYGSIPCIAEIKGKDGTDTLIRPQRWPLQPERVRHVGDPIAFVVAETLVQAKDAAELIEVGYDPLPSVTETGRALTPEAAEVWPEAPGNRAFTYEAGDPEAVTRAFAAAAHVAEVELVNSRVVVASMEPRGAIAAYDPESESWTLHLSGQNVHLLRDQIAGRILGVEPDQVRLIAPDVGGGFGMKNFLYPEYVMLLWTTKVLGRPVKWIAERSEDFVAATQGRDQIARAAIALDETHRITGFRIRTVANLGAYLSTNGPMIPTRPSSIVLGGCYSIPAIDFRVEGAFTNTVPTDAYRGAGRPEAAYLIERVIDQAAHELGLEPVDLRRRNYIQPPEMPYRTFTGLALDDADFEGVLDRALRLAGAESFAKRRQEAAMRGKLRGLGIASYYEATLGLPSEAADLRFEEDGTVTLLIGTQSNGQGLETAFAQLLNEFLEIPPERMQMVQADTGRIGKGYGHGGSRSLQLGGAALMRAAEIVRERGRDLAAAELEAAPADIVFENGGFAVIGTDRRIGLFDLAARHRENGRSALDARGAYTREAFTFPNGAHVAEVEIEPETGAIQVIRYSVCDDFGRVVNPLLIEGQVQGGVVQGLGQVLGERTLYRDGQLVSGSFMDYALPRAGDVGTFAFAMHPVATATNPLGVKGCGEAGCIGALPALVNAVLDALRTRGVQSIDMPITSERVWRLLNLG